MNTVTSSELRLRTNRANPRSPSPAMDPRFGETGHALLQSTTTSRPYDSDFAAQHTHGRSHSQDTRSIHNAPHDNIATIASIPVADRFERHLDERTGGHLEDDLEGCSQAESERRPERISEQEPGGNPHGTSMCGGFRGAFSNWRYEVLSWLMGCLAITVWTYGVWTYSQKPVDSWSHYFSPSSVTSALSTIAQSFLLVSVSNCISQLKWSWVKEDGRPKYDIQIFDEASRGTRGCLSLCWSFLTRDFVARTWTDFFTSVLTCCVNLL